MYIYICGPVRSAAQLGGDLWAEITTTGYLIMGYSLHSADHDKNIP